MIAIFLLLILCGFLIYCGVFTTVSAFSFWWPDRIGLMAPLFNMITFGKYPVTIYNKFLQHILMWIIPFAFVAFFPSTYFFGSPGFLFYTIITPLIAIACMVVGVVTWSLGIRHYESTGS